MDNLNCFGNIEHSPAWYYNKFPGFASINWYIKLSEWSKGVRELHELDDSELLEMGLSRNDIIQQNKN